MIGYVFKSSTLAGELRRDGADTVFTYRPEYLSARGLPIACTLPLSPDEVRRPGTAVPAFFAGLLPEGRRLSSLQRSIKASADDDLALLLAVGSDTVGDVCVLPSVQGPVDGSGMQIPVSTSDLDFGELMSRFGITAHPRIAGIVDKASASMISIPASRADERFIVKFTPPEFSHLAQNEFYFLSLARHLKIAVSPASILTDRHGERALCVRRFDRAGSTKLAVEDGTQVLNRYPGDKYNLDFSAVVTALSNQTIAPMFSKINLLTQLAFAWLTGNGDLHAKNVSVVKDGSSPVIAPMYDVPSTVFYPDVDSELALDVLGHRTLTTPRFVELARGLGLTPRAIDRIRDLALQVTASLPDDIEAGALPFDSRVNVKAARQLRARRRDFSS